MVTIPERSGSRRWLWIAAGWLGLGLFDAMQTIFVMQSEGMHHAWPKLFVVTVFGWVPWALATIPILRLGRRWPAHVVACAAIALVCSLWGAWLEIVFNPYGQSPAPQFVALALYRFYNGILSAIIVYVGVLALGYAVESRDRLALARVESARLSETLSQAQLDALRRQIEPHFLFNTFNAIAGLVREGRSDEAVSTIARLSEFLRRTVADSARQEVSLREEMEFVQTYLDIARVRFGDRLQLCIEIPSDLYPAAVPNLILQPLVENAVKHGIAQRAQGGEIRIAASRRNGTLTLCVSNDGPGLAAGWQTGERGIGITNVRTRLQALYGEAFALQMSDRDGGGVEVVVSLPFRGYPEAQ